MENNQPQKDTLDPQVVNLAKAIRQTESGGDFKARGKSGEYGAYQFTNDTWNSVAPKYGVNVPLEQSTPEQQNEVVYKRVKDWKDSGKNVGQIASMWNAGEGEPDAYTGNFSNGKPSVGVNSSNAKYDVPTYAKSVATAYQTLKNGGQVQKDPNNPSSVKDDTPKEETYGALFPSSPTDSPIKSGLKAVGNLPTSLFGLAKNIGNMVLHPGDTGDALSSALAGGIEKLIPGQHQYESEKTFDTLTQSLKNRYGSWDNLQKTATNDPMGFGADVLSLLEGGAGLADMATEGANATKTISGAVSAMKNGALGDSAKLATAGTDAQKIAQGGLFKQALDSTLSTVAKPIKSVVEAPFNLAKSSATGLLGGLTGKGGGAIESAVSAGTGGISPYKTFMSSLLGKTDPSTIVGQARDALGEVVSQRSNTYKTMLDSLGADKSTYDISPIMDQLDSQLKKFNIGVDKDGALDFSRSKFALDSTAQNDIQKVNDFVKNYGTKTGDKTALGIDNLKQVLGGYYSPNSDYRAFTEGLRSSTRSILDKAPGYTQEMKNYSEMTDNIKEIQRGLSLGDKAAAETSFNKLMAAVKGNNPIKQQLLQQLNEISGGKLIPSISGSMLNPLASKGILAHMAEIGGVGAVAGGAGIVPLLVSMMTTSPRLVGAFVSTLGLGAGGIKTILDILSKGVPATNAVSRITPQYPKSVLSGKG